MDILLYSNSPFQFSGYATVAQNLLRRVNDYEGHNMDILCCSGLESSEVITVAESYSIFSKSPQGGKMAINDVQPLYNRFDYDAILSVMDWWILGEQGQMNIPRIHYTPIDHRDLSPLWRQSLAGAMKVVPYTEFGKEVMENGGVDNITESIPHGVDTDIFDKRDKGPGYLGYEEDSFVFGIFKANQGTRLHMVEMLQAFKLFKERNDADDAKLYLHTMLDGEGFNIVYWLKKLGLHRGNEVRYVDQQNYRFGTIDHNLLADAYSACDIILNTVKGEGWGLPITEGGACGVPAIGTDFSAMPELIGEDEERGWLVPVDRYEPTQKHALRSYPEVENIAKKMEEAYHNRDEVEEKGEKMYEWTHDNLDWDDVVDDYWVPMFDEIDEQEEESTGLGPISVIQRENSIDTNEFSVFTQHLQDAPGKNILELGCGSGILAKYLEERGYNVTAVDVSEYAIERAKGRDIEETYQLDIEEDLLTYFAEGQFDAIISQHVIEHVDDVKILQDSLDLLREDGLVINVVPTRAHFQVKGDLDPSHERYYSIDDVVRLREELTDVAVSSHPEGRLDMAIILKEDGDSE